MWLWDGSTCFLDVGFTDDSGNVIGCIQVVHTHSNSVLKEEAIEAATQTGWFLYMEINTKNLQFLLDGGGKMNGISNVVLSREEPRCMYCSGACQARAEYMLEGEERRAAVVQRERARERERHLKRWFCYHWEFVVLNLVALVVVQPSSRREGSKTVPPKQMLFGYGMVSSTF